MLTTKNKRNEHRYGDKRIFTWCVIGEMLNDCLINKHSIHFLNLDSDRQSLIDRGREFQVLARETVKDED